MLRTLHALEHDKQLRPTKLHVIKAPKDKRGGEYRQLVVFCGFINRILNRWYNHWHSNIEYISKAQFKSVNEEDLQSNIEARQRLIDLVGEEEADKFLPTLQRSEHESVWQFFESINYGYKNRTTKYLDSFVVSMKNTRR